MKTENKLSQTQSQLNVINTVGTWNSTNLTINNEAISTFRPGGYRMLAMSVTDSSLPAFIELQGVNGGLEDINQLMTFAFALRMLGGGLTRTTITENVYGVINEVTEVVSTSSGSEYLVSTSGGSQTQAVLWKIVRADSFRVTGTNLAPSFNIKIEFEPEDSTEIFYMTSPVFLQEWGYLRLNAAFLQLARNLPQWIKDATLSSTQSPNNQLFRYMDVGSIYLDKAIEYLFAYKFFDISMGFTPTNNLMRSTLVDPVVADFQTLLWLVSFVFTRPVTDFELSPEFLPEPFILDQSLLGGTDRLVLTSYSALNPPVVSRALQLNLLRWQATTGYYGSFVGTLPAIREAAKQMLIGNKTISVNYDWEVAPWVINVSTPWNETYGGDLEGIGEQSDLVLEAISHARPLGVLVNHSMTTAV